VSSRLSLSLWLFRLHNDVNRRTSKPKFPWEKYNERWGPSDIKPPIQKKGDNIGGSRLQKNTASLYSNSLRSTSTYGFSSGINQHGKFNRSSLLYRMKSHKRSKTNGQLNAPKNSRASIGHKPVAQYYSSQGSEKTLPRRCLSKQELNLRRNRLIRRNGPCLPRRRVSRRSRRERVYNFTK